MEERKLSWPERGKLWARLGIRLALAVLALWLLQAVGLPLLSLFAPFVAALITAAILHPPIRWLQRRLGVPRKFSTLLILLLLFGLWRACRAPWIRSRSCPPSCGGWCRPSSPPRWSR